jgi:hypothetical protein
MNETIEREAFKRAFSHCDLTDEKDASGQLQFTAAYVQAAWTGWLTRSDMTIKKKEPK